MICVPISSSSRGSSALTLACVPTGMNTGVSTMPWAVRNFPRRALVCASVLRSSNISIAEFPKRYIHQQIRGDLFEILFERREVAVTGQLQPRSRFEERFTRHGAAGDFAGKFLYVHAGAGQ